jgi:SAM-dependent MidA family methyltransferase
VLAETERRGGFLSFDRFMELALYEPGLGYYVNGSPKFGPAGDFETAAGLGDWLAQAVADLAAVELARLGGSTVLEIGAGTGGIAAAMLTRFERSGSAVRYLIHEASPELRERQRRVLEPWAHRVTWLERLPDPPIDAFVFANEVADALPVERFTKTHDDVLPLGVAADGAGGLRWAHGPRDPTLSAAVARLEMRLGRPLPAGYTSEVCLRLPRWIAALATSVARGGILVIDYGLVRREYYHRERHLGTLLCHYRHRAHADPFLYPGLQDVSAWVDFSACADAAAEAGLEVAGFTTQAQFLLASLAAEAAPTMASASALKTLVLPGEMGEKFKVLWLTKGEAAGALPGRDLRSRL